MTCQVEKVPAFETAGNKNVSQATSVPLTRWLENKSINGIFKVKYKDIQGMGAFYEILDTHNCKRWLFITSNHVVPSNSLEDILEFMYIVFPNIDDSKDNTLLNFKRELLLCCWTRQCYCIDATVIELSAKGEKYFRDMNVTFFEISYAKVNDPIAILDLSDGLSNKFAYGRIKSVKKSKVCYEIATKGGNSGDPLIDQNCSAVAIHTDTAGPTNEYEDNSHINEPERPRKAIALREIVLSFLNESETLYGLMGNFILILLFSKNFSLVITHS